MKDAILLRKLRGKLTACIRGKGWLLSANDVSTPPPLHTIAFALCLMLIPALLVLGVLAALLAPDLTTLATAPLPFAFAGMARSRADLDKIISECEAIEAKYKGKPMPEDEGKKLADLYAEGEVLSKEINEEAERQKKMKRMQEAKAYLAEVPDPALPDARKPEQKTAATQSVIAGYITPGHLVTLSKTYRDFHKSGAPRDRFAMIDIAKSLLGIRNRVTPDGLIALTEPEAKQIGEQVSQMETKDLPILGEYVIAPNRVDRFVQDTRPDTLTLRDILNVSPTSSPTIQYIAEVAYTEGADVQSEGSTGATMALKPDADVQYELREESVKTIAVTIPVTEQQLSDAPALINRINTRLLWDLRKKEEQLCGYGTGTALSFKGFFDAGTGISDAAARTVAGDTLIDIIRRGITDVMTDEYMPTAVWMHPIDWESVELEKGSEGHYIWAVIRDQLGARIWSTRVVQGVGTKKAGATERNLLIGDFQNGATLYDREQSNIAVGWIDDQFARNMRTIRAEERAVLAVEAVKAFRKYQTAA